MFNVTILKMKDIIKYIMGITITIIIVVFVSKQFQNSKNEKNIINKVENGINMITEQSLLSCFEQAVPTMANINKEYSEIAKEDDHSKENLLQSILKTQISSIQGMESNENKEKTENTNNVNSTQENTETQEIVQNTRNRRSGSENRSNNKQSNKRNI